MVKTEKSTYYQGEALAVIVIATNPQPNDVVLSFSSSAQATYTMDNYTPRGGALAVITFATVPGGGTFTWRIVHSWSEYKPEPGTHTLAGTVIGYGSSPTTSFSIIPSPAAQANLMVDFDHIPGTDATVGDLIAYEPVGVKFGSFAGGKIAFQGPSTNRYLGTTFCNYPTGFNLAVYLDQPTYGVKVNVIGGTGRRITMLALDADNRVVAAATSSPISSERLFVPLLLHAGQPISSLQFWPETPNSSVAIDDLFLELVPSQPDPPSALRSEVISGGLRLTWPVELAHMGLEMSPNLLPGSWQFIGGSDLTNSFFSPLTSSPAFFRVRLPVGSTTLD